MGLSDLRHRHPLSLAQGDRARVVIAAVLAMRPDVLIFDEPTTGQDYQGAKRILDVSQQLHRAGKTVIAITHHLYLMPGYAERAVVMGRGVILEDAPIHKAFHNSELLRSTYLTAPQIVRLSQYVEEREQVALPILTPGGLAGCMRQRRSGP
jgi:energy-coupling factor transport system ATP-binding protein